MRLVQRRIDFYARHFDQISDRRLEKQTSEPIEAGSLKEQFASKQTGRE